MKEKITFLEEQKKSRHLFLGKDEPILYKILSHFTFGRYKRQEQFPTKNAPHDHSISNHRARNLHYLFWPYYPNI